MSTAAHILALPPGYVLESYRIERVLGEGGFGITYLAVEMESEKQVAIKEMLPGDIATRVAGSTVVPKGDHLRESFEWALDCFGKEARALAKLSHPNIVPIHRLFRANGTAYMVMDFVEGESFKQWLTTHPQPDEEELRGILLPLLDGLENVHEKGLLHRDIKPDNIFITVKGRPVLLDFGAARVDTGRTQTMTAVVSEGYSPFEQYQKRVRLGPATDLYALAGVMVRAITGETPPPSVDRIADETFFKPVSKTHAPRYSAGFLRAVDAAFAVKAQDRPQSVAAWREMLGTGVGVRKGVNKADTEKAAVSRQSSSSSGRGEPSGGRSWLPWAALALVFLGMGAGIIVLRGDGSAAPEGASSLAPQAQSGELGMTSAPAAVSMTQQQAVPSKPFAGSTPGNATKDAPFVNSLGMKFVPVPGTKVLFCIHEARNADYAEYALASSVDEGWKAQAGNGQDPVVNVSWEDATAFCTWLSKKEGRTYRLPADHEWSCAVRLADLERESDSPEVKDGKIEDVYPWGNTYPPTPQDGNYGLGSGSDGYSRAAPVMQFSANALGLHDLGGNVWEWCGDWYNPLTSRSRVLRGGSWMNDGSMYLLSSNRGNDAPGFRSLNVGFRVALER